MKHKCYFCKKPIEIKELGWFFVGKDNKDQPFHYPLKARNCASKWLREKHYGKPKTKK